MSEHAADRNLLLGILAFQMDFVSRDQLMAAMHAWVLDKAKSLDEILWESGALREDTRTLLVALVDKHLEMHEGDAEKSLAAVSSIGSLRDELKSLGDRQTEETLSIVSQDRESLDPHATATLPASLQGTRFRILRPHAKGGLGEVSVARDMELNREVALKEIQERFADDPNSRARFLLEAEVTGGLEHPGIVPVYGLGQYADGRPFYAMRFITGDSLKKAVGRFHQSNLTYDSVEFRKLLGRFIDVCQAIEYAHSRGVLHRDLKPGNIMLGKYGETLVIDWGLAKAVGRDEKAVTVSEQPTLHPGSGSGSAPTMMGSVIGTPAFMSPEQAAGRLDQLGPETDVYSLGATLYYILTEQSPFNDEGIGTTLKNVQRGEFVKPRERNLAIPIPLEAICLRAMSTQPADRYASPRELADEVERYLADEQITSYVEPLTTQTRRWLRKHPRSVAAMAATILVGLVGTVVIALIVSQHNKQLAQTNEQLQAANDAERRSRKEADEKRLQAERSGEQERLAKQHAEAKHKEAEQARVRAKKAIDSYVDAVTEEALLESDRYQPLRQKLLADALAYYNELVADYRGDVSANQEVAEALRRVHKLSHNSGFKKEALEAVQRAADIYRAILAQEPGNALIQDDLAECLAWVGDNQFDLGEREVGIESLDAARAICRELASLPHSENKVDGRSHSYQEHLAQIDMRLGVRQLQFGRYDDAEASMRSALDLYSLLHSSAGQEHLDRDSLAHGRMNLGLLYRATGRHHEASDELRYAYQVIKQDFDAEPAAHRSTLAMILTNLAAVQSELQNHEEAEQLFEEARRHWQQLADSNPTEVGARTELAWSHDNLANLCVRRDQPTKALEHLDHELALWRELANQHPKLSLYPARIAVAQQKAASIQYHIGDLAAAQQSEELASLAIIAARELELKSARDSLGNHDPKTLDLMNDLAWRCYQQGLLDRSIPLYEELLEITRDALGADDPKTLITMANLGANLFDAERYEEAIPLLREAYERTDQQVLQEELARTLRDAYIKSGKSQSAAEVISERLKELRATLPPDGLQLAEVLEDYGTALLQLQLWERAKQVLRECQAIQERISPNEWQRFQSSSLLGAAFLGRANELRASDEKAAAQAFAEAESLLLTSVRGLQAHADAIPVDHRNYIKEGLSTLIELYVSWEKPEEASKWQAELDRVNAE